MQLVNPRGLSPAKSAVAAAGTAALTLLCAGSVGQRAAHGIQSLDTVHCLLGPVCAVSSGTSGHHHRFGHLVGEICRPAKGTTCRGFGIVAHDRFIYGHHCGVGCGSVLERESGKGGLRFGVGWLRGWSCKSVRSVEEIPKEIVTPQGANYARSAFPYGKTLASFHRQTVSQRLPPSARP